MAKIIGIKKVHYTKGNGVEVNGVELHYTYESKHVDGVAADKAFINMAMIERNNDGRLPDVGDDIEFVYGRARDGRAYITGYRY